MGWRVPWGGDHVLRLGQEKNFGVFQERGSLAPLFLVDFSLRPRTFENGNQALQVKCVTDEIVPPVCLLSMEQSRNKKVWIRGRSLLFISFTPA